MGGSNSKSAASAANVKRHKSAPPVLKKSDKNANKQNNKNSNHCRSSLQRDNETIVPPLTMDSSRPAPKTNGHSRVDGQQQALENVLAEQIRTLEKEKESLTANLPTLDLVQAPSDEDNYSTDDLSLDEDGGPQHEKPISFEESPENNNLRHLVKHRAPLQIKRKPTRYQKPEEQQVNNPNAKKRIIKKGKKPVKKPEPKDKKFKKKDNRRVSDPKSDGSVAVV